MADNRADVVLRDLFWQCCNGQAKASFAATYARLLAYGLPRAPSKQLLRRVFAEHGGGNPLPLEFRPWREALEQVSCEIFPDQAAGSQQRGPAALGALVQTISECDAICADVADFVHALGCLDVLNISFCYWDAFRLHRRYASRGFRGLLHALKASNGIQDPLLTKDPTAFGQRLLQVDKTSRQRYGPRVLDTLDRLSSVLIELYPDMGLGCSFVEFVDNIVADKLLPVLCATHLQSAPERLPGAARTDDSAPSSAGALSEDPDAGLDTSSADETLEDGTERGAGALGLHPLSHDGGADGSGGSARAGKVGAAPRADNRPALLQGVPHLPRDTLSPVPSRAAQRFGDPAVDEVLAQWRLQIRAMEEDCARAPSVESWLSRAKICPAQMDFERADAAWEAAEGDFESFVCFLAWMSDLAQDRSGTPASQISAFMTVLSQNRASPGPARRFTTRQDPERVSSSPSASSRRRVLSPARREPVPLLMQIFVSGCPHEMEVWTSACWFGFVYTYTSPLLSWSTLLEIQGDHLLVDFDTFHANMKCLAQSRVNMNLTHVADSLVIKPPSLDLQFFRSIAKLVLTDGAGAQAFDKLAAEWVAASEADNRCRRRASTGRQLETPSFPIRIQVHLEALHLLAPPVDPASPSDGQRGRGPRVASWEGNAPAWYACIASLVLPVARSASRASLTESTSETPGQSPERPAKLLLSASGLNYMLRESQPMIEPSDVAESVVSLLSADPNLAEVDLVSVLLFDRSAHRTDQAVAFDMDPAFAEDAFVNLVSTSPASIEQIERSLGAVTSEAELQILDQDLFREYSSIFAATVRVADGTRAPFGPALVEAVLRRARATGCAVQQLVLLLFSKPVYLSRAAAYDHLLRPSIVTALETARPAAQTLLKRFADPETELLSERGFLRCLESVNLSVGIIDNPLSSKLVSLLRTTITLRRVYAASVDSGDHMGENHFVEALGRLGLALATHFRSSAPVDKGSEGSGVVGSGLEDDAIKCLVGALLKAANAGR